MDIVWNIILLLSLNLLLYARSLRFGYISDDLLSEKRRRDKTVAKDERIWQSSTSGKPKLDHGISIAVHAACACFIYTGLGGDRIALMAAILFSANPINNQGSVWISGRHYAWCALFLMMAKTSGYFGMPAMIAATVHPTALFAPLGYIGSSEWYLVLFLPIVWLIHWKHFKSEVTVRRGNEVVDFDKRFSWQKIIIAIKIYGFYFAICLIPWSLTWYHSFMQSGAGAGNDIMKKRSMKLNWMSFLGLGLIGYLIYSAIFNWTPVSWGVLWYSCAIGPYLNLFRMQQEIAERYCYIANIGVMFVLANILPIPAFGFFLGFYVARLWGYLPAFTDDYWLIEKGINEDPAAWYCWYIRGHKRWQQQAIREALNCWVMAKMLSPKEFKILFNIGVVLKLLKRDKESEAFMKQAQENVIKGQEETAKILFSNFEKGNNQLLT